MSPLHTLSTFIVGFIVLGLLARIFYLIQVKKYVDSLREHRMSRILEYPYSSKNWGKSVKCHVKRLFGDKVSVRVLNRQGF